MSVPDLDEFVLQAGVVSRTQLLAAGVSDKTIRARVASGRWRRLHPGVYVTWTGPVGREAELWAAILYAGPGATLSHRTAAERHGLIDPYPGVDVTVPVARRVRPRPGVRIHYAHRLDLTRNPVTSPPTTRVEDTVLDLVDVAYRSREAIDWLTRACQRRRTTPERLRAALDARKKVRRRELLEGVLADVDDGAETPLELEYLRRVESAHGLPTGKRQRHRRSGGKSQWIDVEYTAHRVRVELDGRIGHVEDGAFRDRRANLSATEGFLSLRYGWAETYGDSCRSAGEVAGVLRSRGWRGELRACAGYCPFNHGDHEGSRPL